LYFYYVLNGKVLLDFIKDSTEAWLARIRSPILGSIGLAFVAFNWRPLWYLVFAEQPVSIKFRFFEMNTSTVSLYVAPILFGLFFAVLTPWIKLVGAQVAISPVKALRKMEFDQSHDQKIYRLNRQAEVAKVQAATSQAERSASEDVAAASQAALEASRAATEADEAKAEAEKVRDRRNQDSATQSDEIVLRELHSSLDMKDLFLLELLAGMDAKINPNDLSQEVRRFLLGKLELAIPNINGIRLEAELKDAFERFHKLSIAERDGRGGWSLTSRGFAMIDYLKKEAQELPKGHTPPPPQL